MAKKLPSAHLHRSPKNTSSRSHLNKELYKASFIGVYRQQLSTRILHYLKKLFVFVLYVLFREAFSLNFVLQLLKTNKYNHFSSKLSLRFITARIIAYLISHLQYFIYNFSFIPHGLIRTHKWPAPNGSGFKGVAPVSRVHGFKLRWSRQFFRLVYT